MPISLPYLPSNKNIGKLLQQIAAAKVPPKVSTRFLTDMLGLKGTADRALIPMLRNLGYIDQSGTPTAKYSELKNPDTAAASVATGIRAAYAPLFAADENAQLLTGDKLKGKIAQVAGTDEGMSTRIAQTFTALVKLANFADQPAPSKPEGEGEDEDDESDHGEKDRTARRKMGRGFRPDFHYNIQIHLPANGTEDVYLNIFNALRKVFE
jgi:hypothetical protein